MTPAAPKEDRAGIIYATLAYVCWGLFPIYFKSLQGVPALEILMHRMAWSLVFVLAVLAVRRQWAWLFVALRSPAVLARFGASALVLSANWFVYIWSVNAGHVVDASLGYFINPLVNVLLAFFILKERLRNGQWMAIALAAVGVGWLTWQGGQLPWIGLILACSFGTYGLLRKTASLGPLEGLTLETLLLFPFAAGYLIWLGLQGQSGFLDAPPLTKWLLVAAGPITAIPLLMFATGARRISFALLGILQYVGPTLQLLIGVWLYKENFGPDRAVGYGAIWAALIVYSLEGIWQARRRQAAAPEAT